MGDDERRRLRLPQQIAAQVVPSFLRDLLRSSAAAEPEVADGGPLTEDDDEVLGALRDLGVPADEAEAAVRDGRVPLVIAQHRRRDNARYSLDELAEKSGVPAEVIVEVFVAMGIPLPARFGKRDLQWARQARRLLDVLPVGALIRSARARGVALSAVARADLAVVRDELMLPMRQAGADDLTLAVALAEAAGALEEIAKEGLVHTYELALDHQLSSQLVAMAAQSAREEVDIAVGFVDMEGYTALSARIDPEGLDATIDAFEHRIQEVLASATDVSPVKYLGDAVMLVAAEPVALAEVMFDLTTPVEELADSPLRGGMAAGPVIVREGDYYGPSVNLAARLTGLARTWSVLADEDLDDVLEDAFDVRRIRPTRIRGVGTRRPVALATRRG